MRLAVLRLIMAASLALGSFVSAPAGEIPMRVDPAAVMELLPLALEAMEIYERATAREEAHIAELRRKGIAEEPPSEGQLYSLNTAGLGKMAFDEKWYKNVPQLQDAKARVSKKKKGRK